MNLHGIVAGYIGAVNPQMPVTLQSSTGSSISADGARTPTYACSITLLGQIQPLTYRDLTFLDGLNIQGVRWKIYLSGQADGIVRVEAKGGDLVTIPVGPHAGIWLISQVLEQWPDWCACAITLQNGS